MPVKQQRRLSLLKKDQWLDTLAGALVFVAFLVALTHRPDRLAASTPTMPALGPSRVPDRVVRTSGMLFAIDSVQDSGRQSDNGGAATSALDPRAGHVITVTGWAVDGGAQRPGTAVMIEVDSRRRIRARYGIPRPDVAAYFGVPACLASGFQARISATGLRAGRHSVSLLMRAADGKALYTEKDKVTLTVI